MKVKIRNELTVLGDEKRVATNKKRGASDNQFGVAMGEIRKMAKKIKINHELALELLQTENMEARLIAILIFNPKLISKKNVAAFTKSLMSVQVADWFNAYIVKKHPDNEDLRLEWMQTDDPISARAGWNLTAIRVIKNPAILDLEQLLNRIEKEMLLANPLIQWSMNYTLAEIGINFPKYRSRAIAIAEDLGVYKDFPTSKGCTSPFAPIWIIEMVKRQG